jgi:hypothetical protein
MKYSALTSFGLSLPFLLQMIKVDPSQADQIISYLVYSGFGMFVLSAVLSLKVLDESRSFPFAIPVSFAISLSFFAMAALVEISR